MKWAQSKAQKRVAARATRLCPSDNDDFSAIPDPEIACIALELDRSIMRSRRASALRQIVPGQPVPLPVKPSRIELLVLTALQTNGPLLFCDDFKLVLEQIS